MPLYEYQCGSCGTRVEKIQKFSDPPFETCEACGGPLRKLPSSPAIQFKGSGWYVTDYAKKTAVEGTATTGKPEGTSDAGSGDKPAAKSESPAGGGGGGTAGSKPST